MISTEGPLGKNGVIIILYTCHGIAGSFLLEIQWTLCMKTGSYPETEQRTMTFNLGDWSHPPHPPFFCFVLLIKDVKQHPCWTPITLFPRCSMILFHKDVCTIFPVFMVIVSSWLFVVKHNYFPSITLLSWMLTSTALSDCLSNYPPLQRRTINKLISDAGASIISIFLMNSLVNVASTESSHWT